jgi:hypothetical protein
LSVKISGGYLDQKKGEEQQFLSFFLMNNPAAEQRGIFKCIECPKGRGITPGEIK